MNDQKKLTLYMWIKESGIALFLFTGAVYLLFFYWFIYGTATVTMYDAGHYHSAALDLLKHGNYVSSDGSPLFYRLPAYSTFLAVLYSLVGQNVWSALVLQVLLLATMPLLVRRFILKLTGRVDLARITAWLSVFAPGYMIFSGLLLTDMLFAWLFLLFMNVFLSVVDGDNIFLPSLMAGLLLGGLSLIRPVGHLLLPFLIIFILLFTQTSWLRKLSASVALLSGWVALAGAWLFRNFLLTGVIFFHTLPGPHFINHVAVRLVSMGPGISYEEAKKVVYEKLREREAQSKSADKTLSEIEQCKLFEQEAAATIKQYPREFIALAVVSCIKTTLGLYSSELLVIDAKGVLPSYEQAGFMRTVTRYLCPKVENKWIVAVIWLELLLLVLAIFGFCLAVVRYWKTLFHPRSVFVLGTICFFIGISFACGYARLRLSVEVFYLLAASYACCELIWWCRSAISKGLSVKSS